MLGNIKVVIDCYHSDPPFNLSHHFIVYSVSSSLCLSLVVCSVSSIGNGQRSNRPPTVAASQFPLDQFYCYWVPATKESWCTIHQSSVLRLPQVLRQSSLLHLLQVHHSRNLSVSPSTSVAPVFTVAPSTRIAPIFTVAPSTVAPFYRRTFTYRTIAMV